MAHWGFTYKSEVVWDKQAMGLGNYARLQHETLLLGARGGQTTLSTTLRSVVEERRGKHSSKLERFRRLIEMNSPNPRLELFARGISPGWITFGNQ